MEPDTNVLNNSLTGDGPTLVRGTDPVGAPGGMSVADASWTDDIVASVAGYGETIARGVAGIALGLVLIAMGLYIFAKDA